MPRLPITELTRYLEQQHLAPEQTAEIQARYSEVIASQNAASWTRDQTYEWLNAEVEATSGRPATQTLPSALADKSGPGSGAAAAGEALAQSSDQAAAAADAAGMAADQRAAATRARYTASGGYGMDQGPVANPDMIGTSLAVGAWVDEAGNPIDPYTQQPVTEALPATAADLWNLIRGQRFNMGSVAMPGFAERRTKNFTPSRRGFTGTEPGTRSPTEGGAKLLAKLGVPPDRSYNFDRPDQTRIITPSQAMGLLGSMDEDYLTGLQHQMWEAGLYSGIGEGARPEWGRADPITRKAFQALFLEASTTPDIPISQVLSRLAERNILDLADVPGAPGSSTGQAPDFTPEVASAATLSKLVDEMGTELLGHHVTDDEKKSIIGRLQASETDTQRQQYMQDVDRFNRGGGTSGASGIPGMEDIDAFMAAIGGLESGGNYGAQNPGGAHGKYQIMPDNWAPWATRAGLGPNAPQTPQNQEIVAKRKMMDYYAQFHSWRDVAIAWFAGPNAVGAPGAGSRSDGNMTVREYADSILNKMAGIKGAPSYTGAGAVAGQQFDPVERFDPAAETEAILKAQDPQGWYGHQFADRAVQYFNLLQGVAS